MPNLDFLYVTKLARWWNAFNNWEWPDDFPYAMPKRWKLLPLYGNNAEEETRYKYTKTYMRTIEARIGIKECLRFHHLNNLHMKNYQFEVWWFVDSVINKFWLKYINKNFIFDIYSVMKWRKNNG